MTNEQNHSLRGALTDTQTARLEYARRDLESARAEDLAHLPLDGLILLVERLRLRLDDVLTVVDEALGGAPHP